MDIQNKSNKKNSILLFVFIVALICITAISSGFYFGLQKNKTALSKDLSAATLLPQPRSIVNFSLIDNRGSPFTNIMLQGHWTFMFFGFTSCGSICPVIMAELNKTYQLLLANKTIEPDFYLITLDPKNDTPKKLNTFVTAFNVHFKGATGNELELDKLTKAMNVVYLKIQSKSNSQANHYTIDHSGALMLLDPQGRLVAIFSMPHDAKKIANDYQKIIKFYS